MIFILKKVDTPTPPVSKEYVLGVKQVWVSRPSKTSHMFFMYVTCTQNRDRNCHRSETATAHSIFNQTPLNIFNFKKGVPMLSIVRALIDKLIIIHKNNGYTQSTNDNK